MCQRILMRPYASSPRKVKSGYERSDERDYKGLLRPQEAIPVSQLISRVVPREKRVSGDPL